LAIPLLALCGAHTPHLARRGLPVDGHLVVGPEGPEVLRFDCVDQVPAPLARYVIRLGTMCISSSGQPSASTSQISRPERAKPTERRGLPWTHPGPSAHGPRAGQVA
jgi:hypothetical protein